jgi:hypothetical protein
MTGPDNTLSDVTGSDHSIIDISIRTRFAPLTGITQFPQREQLPAVAAFGFNIPHPGVFARRDSADCGRDKATVSEQDEPFTACVAFDGVSLVFHVTGTDSHGSNQASKLFFIFFQMTRKGPVLLGFLNGSQTENGSDCDGF